MIEVVKTDAQYQEVLARVNALVAEDPASGSERGRELEILTVLVRDYESRVYPLAPANPLAAIRLRMEQAGLAAKDLVPYLGSKSRVSEVLSGKRALSLAMIRALHEGLRIPLESLVAEQAEESGPDSTPFEWDRFPLKQMARRGWIRAPKVGGRWSISAAQAAVEEFLQPVGGLTLAHNVMHKRDRVRSGRAPDRFALVAWAAYVLRTANSVRVRSTFRRLDWEPEQFRELRNLSRYDVGPRLAVQYLLDRGIVVVVAPHLPGTRLDGAAMLRADGAPVVGMTLRHDRIDNFWFTLFHELVHVLKHLSPERTQGGVDGFIFDDLDAADTTPFELEADEVARKALVSDEEWNNSAARFVVAPVTVSQLAAQIGVADAVVAGRVRFEHRNYRLLSSMVGIGEVRRHFPGHTWDISEAK